MTRHILPAALLVLAVVTPAAPAAEAVARHLRRPDTWFASDEAKRIAANILSQQSDLGGWPKNTDTTAPFTGDRAALKPTFDNRATTDELRFLARMVNATKDDRYRTAFEKGTDYILKAQYPTGGWPQFYPPPKTYHRYITFNDDAMVRLLEFLRETYTSDRYAFLDAGRKQAARAAFDKGIECILKCQINVDGKLTAWCAQHDEKDFSPRPGRTYELVSLSGAESVGIVRLLMSLDHPSPEVVRAIEGAVAWFEAAKLPGIRVVIENDPKAPRGRNKVVVKDPTAPPMWARFYEIGTNRPLFADRDGVAKYDLSEIGYERRNGYNWLSYWPADLLAKDYPPWKAKHVGPPAAKPAVKIVLVGDSTAAQGSGWGPGFEPHLTNGAACVNWARSGRSSKSFINEGWWAKALAEKPDYVLIQFGHNDQPGKGPDRETDPATTFREWMARYVDEARAAGAKPILVTPLTRRTFKGGKIEDTLGPYADAVKRLAAEKKVPVIDLHSRSVALVEKLGPAESAAFDPKPGDRTHLNAKGAAVFGGLVADELKKAEPALAGCLK